MRGSGLAAALAALVWFPRSAAAEPFRLPQHHRPDVLIRFGHAGCETQGWLYQLRVGGSQGESRIAAVRSLFASVGAVALASGCEFQALSRDGVGPYDQPLRVTAWIPKSRIAELERGLFPLGALQYSDSVGSVWPANPAGVRERMKESYDLIQVVLVAEQKPPIQAHGVKTVSVVPARFVRDVSGEGSEEYRRAMGWFTVPDSEIGKK